MKLQSKITLTLLLVSLISAATVGIVSYMLLMRKFGQESRDQAFRNFVSDITGYITEYGSLESGEAQEPFSLFVLKRHTLHNLPQAEKKQPAGGPPPFRFMALSPEGSVIWGGREYVRGEIAPKRILEQSFPIRIDGEIRLRVVQLGEPQLSSQDLAYLETTRKALLTGFVTSGSFAVFLGLFLGRRSTAYLRNLIDAFDSVSLDKEKQREIPARSKDELGQLIMAFNRMNTSLSRAHAELRESHDKIEKQAEDLRELSIRDPLTQLYNRRHFDAHTEIMLHRTIRYKHPFSVMIGDLDHFKRINDRFSHAVGDEVLRTIAGLLLDNTRKSDVAARYGGEEFVIAFPDTSLGQARKFCEKLRKIIEHYPWKTIHPELEVTMSMGVCGDPFLGSMEKMVGAADEQLYESKKRGRNRVMPVLLKVC